jgi:hypothetical protein
MNDSTTQQRDTPEQDKREAQVNHDASGQPLGAAVFFGAEDIAALGINPEATLAVAYWIEDGEVRLDSLEQAVGDE